MDKEIEVREMGGLLMSIDLRLRHDRSTRERAAEMFESGLGYRSVARALGVPAEAVRDWLGKYRATGRDGLLAMDGRRARYDFETKVAAASAVVDGGMAKPEAMERSGPSRRAGRGGRARGPRRRPASRGSNARSAGSRRRWRT